MPPNTVATEEETGTDKCSKVATDFRGPNRNALHRNFAVLYAKSIYMMIELFIVLSLSLSLSLARARGRPLRSLCLMDTTRLNTAYRTCSLAIEWGQNKEE